MKARDLAVVSALDEGGNTVTLGSFWGDRAAILGLVRHFDSASCRKLVTSLKDAQQEIERRGARLIVVGGAKPDAVHDFREAVGYRGPLLVDPSLQVFRAAGMLGEVAPAAPAEAKAASGFFGRLRESLNADVGKLLTMDVKDALTTDLAKLSKDSAETPGRAATTAHDSGVFAVGPGEALGFEWRARGAGDLPKIAELLAALGKK